MKFDIKISILFLLITFIISCKSLNTNITIKSKKLPANFFDYKDSTNMVKINWREFYKDKNLIQLIDSAIVNNIDLQIALQKIEMNRADVKLANGELIPKVNIGINVALRKYGLYTMDGAGNITTEITPGQIVPIHLPDYYVGLGLSYEIDIWGKIRNQKKAALSRYLASIEGTNFIITQLICDVAVLYYELLALDNELEIVKNTILLQKQAIEISKILKETGKITELPIQQFSAQLLSTQNYEIELNQLIFETENRLSYLCGDYTTTTSRNKNDLFNPIMTEINVGFPSDILLNRPDIREAESLVMASKYDLKAAKAAFFPNITLNGSLGLQAFNPQFIFNPSSIAYTAVGGIVSPLVNFNALKANFNYAKASQIEAMYVYQKTILQAYFDVNNSIMRYINLTKKVNLREKEASIKKEALANSIELYTVGRANYLEILYAQQIALETQIILIQEKKELQLSIINLYKSLGGGW